jgi:GxxExxY protein
MDCGYRPDLVVADLVVVEIKVAERLAPVHEAQIVTYLRAGGWKIGNVPLLRDGIKRRILGLEE